MMQSRDYRFADWSAQVEHILIEQFGCGSDEATMLIYGNATMLDRAYNDGASTTAATTAIAPVRSF
jgi:hypothetical protein